MFNSENRNADIVRQSGEEGHERGITPRKPITQYNKVREVRVDQEETKTLLSGQ